MKTVSERVNEVLSDSSNQSKESVHVFIEVLRDNQAKAEERLHRSLITFYATWAFMYAIGAGLVEKGQYIGLEIAQIKQVLIVGPALLGWLFYSIMVAGTAQSLHMTALSSAYRHTLPKVYELDLEYMLPPPTIFSVERVLMGWARWPWLNKIGKIWIWFIAIGLTILPLLAIAHTSWLFCQAVELWWPLRGAAIAIGVILCLRGILLTITGSQAEG